MTGWTISLSADAAPRTARVVLSPGLARLGLLCAIAVGFVAGAVAGGETHLAVAQAGADLVRLLRGMALLKALLSAGVAGAVLWRLAAPVSWAWLGGYAAACAAMAAGPVLIWSMAHVASGALLTHAGLLAAIVLLWRDPAMGARLAAAVAARRQRIAAR